MENDHPNREQQVWQRVLQRQEESSGMELQRLQMTAMELAASFHQLMGLLSGRRRELARQLYEGEMANAAALKGIARLSGSREEVLKLWNPTREPSARLLEASYHKTRRCMTDYLSRSAEAQYGAVFRLLSDREARHCLLLTELLGMEDWPQKNR